MLDVLLKNNQLIAVNKPPGIAVQADKTGDTPLLQLAESYCKHPLHVVNRVDRPVSGIVLFAKSKSAMTALSRQFADRLVEKEYLAVVQALPPEPQGVLRHFLLKREVNNKALVVSEDHKGAEAAELEYRLLGSSDRYHLLSIKLHTGRHHQIRAQLAAAGCPIKGDVKYGFKRGNKDRSIHLHGFRLQFDHPVSGERISLEAGLPDDPVWNYFRSIFINPEHGGGFDTSRDLFSAQIKKETED